jgi:cytochrome c-type biogenesis protein CcmH
MFKGAVVLPVCLLLFAPLACNQRSGNEQDLASRGAEAAIEESNPEAFSHPTVPGFGAISGTISGTITVAPSLVSKLSEKDVVYIIARSADQPGPPVAVQQVKDIRFPYQYSLGPADLMMQTGLFQGKMNVVVRLDRDGAAGPPQPGDMEGVYLGNPAEVGDQNVDILINKEF